MPQILDFLSSDLGVTPHRARSTGSPRGGDCGGPVPSTAACGEGGEDTEAPPCSLPLPPPPLRWGRGGDKGGPSAPAETLGQPPAGEGPPEQKAGFLLETHMVQGEWNACVFKKTDDISGVIGG